VESQGTLVTIGSAKPDDTNTIDEPQKVVPVTTEVKGLGKSFSRVFPAYSVTVVQLQVRE